MTPRNNTIIGWAILAVIPFYIGFFWLIPYIQVALICFYEDLVNKSDANTIEETNPIVEG